MKTSRRLWVLVLLLTVALLAPFGAAARRPPQWDGILVPGPSFFPAPPTTAGPKLVVSRLASAPVQTRAGHAYVLRGTIVNEGAAPARGPVVVHLLRVGSRPLVVGRTLVALGGHSSGAYTVRARLPRALPAGSYALVACVRRAGNAGALGCATAERHLQIGSLPRIGRVRALAAAAAGCSSGAHSLSAFGEHVYPETGNGGYTSVHSDVYVTYDTEANVFLPGTHVVLTDAIMDMQEQVLNFQTAFNGPFPFTTDGVVVGVPNAGFEEEMQTKITFANESIDLQTLHRENMHQWWGDNVSEANYNLTFFKEGLATLGEFLFIAGNAQAAAGGSTAAFEQSLVDTFNTYYAGSDLLWTGAPSDPRPYTLFSGSKTYFRPGIAYIALRRILGPASFNAALQQIQRTYRQGSVTEAQLEAGFGAFLPNPSTACQGQLSQFFSQWWDTVYPPGGGSNRPQITAPGLDGGGFHC